MDIQCCAWCHCATDSTEVNVTLLLITHGGMNPNKSFILSRADGIAWLVSLFLSCLPLSMEQIKRIPAFCFYPVFTTTNNADATFLPKRGLFSGSISLFNQNRTTLLCKLWKMNLWWNANLKCVMLSTSSISIVNWLFWCDSFLNHKHWSRVDN